MQPNAGGSTGKLTLGLWLAAQRLPQKCSTCRVNEDFRKGWGCDAPTEHVQASIPCPSCGGAGPCAHCGGGGKLHFYECPNVILGRDPEAVTIINQFLSYFQPFGIMPAAGGWMDQTAGWYQANQHLSAAWANLESERIEREKKEAERQSRKLKGGGFR